MLEAYLNVQDSVRYALGYLLFEAAKIPALKEDYGLFVFSGATERVGETH